MIARVESFVLQGIEARPCEVEADLSPIGLPKTTVVGLPDVAVRESVQRVRTAVINSGFRYPTQRATFNLAPANIRKEGPVYDLPIAIALLRADGTIGPPGADRPSTDAFLIAGELALDGRVRAIRGGVSLALLARSREPGRRGVIVPASTAAEAAVVDAVDVYGVTHLTEVVAFFNGTAPLERQPTLDVEQHLAAARPSIDFADIRGQVAAKRALTIAAAGMHNILLLGPAGSGKTMMAKALPGILPPLSREEALEVTRLYSSVGQLPRDVPLIVARPVRAPHHTASAAAIIGGGSLPRPGDVSLAHRGVLFLDEMPEFTRAVLETLRQPLEDGVVTIARAHGSVCFPARFMLVAALNPTAHGDAATGLARDRYLGRLSAPLVDRIDLHVEVAPVPFAQLRDRAAAVSSADMRERVRVTRALQAARQGKPNAELRGAELDHGVPLDGESTRLLEQAMRELALSARAYDKIRRIARTIADLEQTPAVGAAHVAEAIQYRVLDRREAGGTTRVR